MSPVVHANEEMAQVTPGSYEVECIETGSFYMENDMYGNPDKVRIKVRITTGADDEPVLDALCNEKLSPKSTLWRWAEAFGLEPEVGGDLDTDEMVGKKALAVIGERKNERGTWARIEDFVPLPKSRAAKAAPPAVEEDMMAFLKVNEQGDPEVDWTLFWKVCTKNKVSKAALIKFFEGKEPKDVDPFDLPAALDTLIVPF